MNLRSMICPQCGMTQMIKPSCESCGKETGFNENTRFAPAPARIKTGSEDRRTVPPPSRDVQAIPNTEESQTFFFSFHGRGSSLFQIYIFNLLFTLLTVGFYYSWAKVKIRKYILGELEFMSDRFAFHGTGREIFLGSLKASFILGILYGIYHSLAFLSGHSVLISIGKIIYFFLFATFIAVAKAGSYRYRLSRTSWRGIHFSFRGQIKEFIEFYLGGVFLNLITFGFYYPTFSVKQYHFLISQSYFGDQKFNFNGRGRDLLIPFCISLFLTIPTLGLGWFWFFAAQKRYFFNHTSYGHGSFHSSLTGWKYFTLNAGNFLLFILSLGLAYPWIVVRNCRFFCKYLKFNGLLKLETVHQESQEASALGEGLGHMLETDVGFGVA